MIPVIRAAVSPNGHKGYNWWCAGCRMFHHADHRWKFNGDLVKPTFDGSFLQRGPRPGQLCHSFVKDGKVRYLDDSHHHLAGREVPLKLPDGR